METTDKAVCRELVGLLAAHGINDVILSPGSRNTPLIMAVARHRAMNYEVVVDERSAAFIALGMAVQRRRPVALVCTSGTAMLNYAPAVAEAFYREVPLVVITADRPCEWIDQDDSQTIRQPGALANIVKQTVDVPVENGSETQMWMVNRLVNDAIISAVSGRPGPVHINVQLDVPLSGITTVPDDAYVRAIDVVAPSPLLPTAQVRAMGAELAPPRKVLVVCGFMYPSQRLSRAIGRLAALPNVAVLCEAQANIHARGTIGNIDVVLNAMTADERDALTPDVVITIGGSLVSRFIKVWLRGRKGIAHWHIGERGQSVDCFKMLQRRIEISPESFMPQLASAMQPWRNSSETYARQWAALHRRAIDASERFVARAPWSDLTAFAAILPIVPPRWNMQLSNGTSVRYVQLFDYSHIHRIDANRGVSGIDGCTSTAIGAALAYDEMTLLITGDMSAQYDLGALAASCIPPTLRIAVLNNGGGGIFRYIKSTASLPELEECFAADVRLPLEKLAGAFGFDYYRARDVDSLMKAFVPFSRHTGRPAILDIQTDGTVSAAVLNNFFKETK